MKKLVLLRKLLKFYCLYSRILSETGVKLTLLSLEQKLKLSLKKLRALLNGTRTFDYNFTWKTIKTPTFNTEFPIENDISQQSRNQPMLYFLLAKNR